MPAAPDQRPDQPSTESPEELDVQTIPHAERHRLIFGKLQALEAGQTFVIRNDHDPKPLRYQTESLWPGVYEWNHLESGPSVWRVAVTRAH